MDRRPIWLSSTDLNTPSLENLEIGCHALKRTSVGCKNQILRTAVPALPKRSISSRRDLVRMPAFPGLPSTKPALSTASRRFPTLAEVRCRGQVRRIADVRRDEHIVRKVPTTDPTHSAVTDLHEIVHLARRNFVQGRRGTASDSVP